MKTIKIIITLFLIIFSAAAAGQCKNTEIKELLTALQQTDDVSAEAMTSIEESRHVFSAWMSGSLEPYKAGVELKKLKVQVLSLQSTVGCLREEGSRNIIKFKKEYSRAMDILPESVEKQIREIKDIDLESKKNIERILKKQTESVYCYLSAAAKKELWLLGTADHASMNNAQKEYLSWRTDMMPIAERQRKVSLDAEMLLLDLYFYENPEKNQELKNKISGIVQNMSEITETYKAYEAPASVAHLHSLMTEGAADSESFLKTIAKYTGNFNEANLEELKEKSEKAKQTGQEFKKQAMLHLENL